MPAPAPPTDDDCDEAARSLERTSLLALLAINAVMFVVEAVAGWLAESTGLLADSLDMFADAAVYGAALAVVGASRHRQARAALASGVVELLLGAGVLAQVVWHLLAGSEPQSLAMMAVGALALVANVACMAIIARHRHGGVHMRASWIFSANDVIANAGVIVSGALVALLDSRVPDLVIGTLIAAVVIRGGIRIVREARAESRVP